MLTFEHQNNFICTRGMGIFMIVCIFILIKLKTMQDKTIFVFTNYPGLNIFFRCRLAVLFFHPFVIVFNYYSFTAV